MAEYVGYGLYELDRTQGNKKTEKELKERAVRVGWFLKTFFQELFNYERSSHKIKSKITLKFLSWCRFDPRFDPKLTSLRIVYFVSGNFKLVQEYETLLTNTILNLQNLSENISDR